MAEKKTRRAFVKGAAQIAVTTPAVAILLNGTSANAQGVIPGYTVQLGDDATASFADDSFRDDTFVTPGDDGTTGGGSS
jgi:hypothetical protein